MEKGACTDHEPLDFKTWFQQPSNCNILFHDYIKLLFIQQTQPFGKFLQFVLLLFLVWFLKEHYCAKWFLSATFFILITYRALYTIVLWYTIKLIQISTVSVENPATEVKYCIYKDLTWTFRFPTYYLSFGCVVYASMLLKQIWQSKIIEMGTK